jgi:hypothetical protein
MSCHWGLILVKEIKKTIDFFLTWMATGQEAKLKTIKGAEDYEKLSKRAVV